MRVFLLAAFMAGIAFAEQPARTSTLIVLPIVGDSMEAGSLKTVNGLYRDALQAKQPVPYLDELLDFNNQHDQVTLIG